MIWVWEVWHRVKLIKMSQFVFIMFEYQYLHNRRSSGHYSHICELRSDPLNSRARYVQHPSAIELWHPICVQHHLARRIDQHHSAVIRASNDLLGVDRQGLLVNKAAGPNRQSNFLKTSDGRDVHASSRGRFFDEAFILSRFLLFFDFRYARGYRFHDQISQAVINKPVGLRQLVKKHRGVSDEFPVVFGRKLRLSLVW